MGDICYLGCLVVDWNNYMYYRLSDGRLALFRQSEATGEDIYGRIANYKWNYFAQACLANAAQGGFITSFVRK